MHFQQGDLCENMLFKGSVKALHLKEGSFVMIFSSAVINMKYLNLSLLISKKEKLTRRTESSAALFIRFQVRLEMLLRLWQEGNQMTFCWGEQEGGASKKAAASLMRYRTHEDGLTRARLTGGIQPKWSCVVADGQVSSVWERKQPLDSSSPLCLYLWVTWLLSKPGNVCSVSMLKEPPLWQLYIHTRWPSYRHLHFRMLLE